MQTQESKTERVAAALASGLDVRAAAKKAGVTQSYVYQVRKKRQNGHAHGAAPVMQAATAEPIFARVELTRGGKTLGSFVMSVQALAALLSALGDSK